MHSKREQKEMAFCCFTSSSNIGNTNKAIIVAEQELTKEKLALKNFNMTFTNLLPMFANTSNRSSVQAYNQPSNTIF
jgi:hypothetical protein